ncbi:MAG: dTDP-4-dehydrorhamnose 3,5-epimerase [Cytophagales bacterium]|nr:dTDP-4-dehydrorhamnose 3,5-epimerase [Cytophagales bacterium]
MTTLPSGVFLDSIRSFSDRRGRLYECFRTRHTNINPAQVNISFSNQGVLRGLHYQKFPYQQAKQVHVLQGDILDVVVDLRRDSNSYGRYFKIFLSGREPSLLYIPKGFAHGFLALTDALVQYMMDVPYVSESQSGIFYDDPTLGIDWELKSRKIKPILSEKDKRLSAFSYEGSAQ